MNTVIFLQKHTTDMGDLKVLLVINVLPLLCKAVWNINGLIQNCSNSGALAMELLQSCTKPLIWCYFVAHDDEAQLV